MLGSPIDLRSLLHWLGANNAQFSQVITKGFNFSRGGTNGFEMAYQSAAGIDLLL